MCKVVLYKMAWEDQMALMPTVDYKPETQASGIKRIGERKSALLMMADSLEYMTDDTVVRSMLNKASYAVRSDRPFYIWLGNLDQAELNRREIETVGTALGAKCTPETVLNSMHYYKPIAFLVLMKILSESGAEAAKSFFYMDADSDFTLKAFEHIDNEFNSGIGPESYLDLSPQASLLATQNTKGKMLMNSGLMLIRNTRWSKDMSAMWWYARCGEKDQLALWLVLFASFSAWTTDVNGASDEAVMAEEKPQFGYPGQIFFSYGAASKKTFLHFRNHAHAIQHAWEALVKEHKTKNQTDKDDSKDQQQYDMPIPTDTQLFNGGTYPGLKPVLYGAMELPHVMILPQAAIEFQYEQKMDTSVVQQKLDLPRLKSEFEDGDSFITHSKGLHSCTNGRCWPYFSE